MLMNKYLYIFIVFLFFTGCSPFSESALRKSGVIQSDDQAKYYENSSIDEKGELDYATRQMIRSYGATIKHYSQQYGFDWRLTLAVIKAESNFHHAAESHRGAEGLMQVMPHTQKEIARQLAIDDLTNPKLNIRAGIFYMRKMYRMFDGLDESDRIRLTLAAYNAGPGRVLDAQKLAKYLSDDPTNWQSVKDALPLLSDRFSTLQNNVWTGRKPKPFNNYRETIAHVEKIMYFYDEYRLLLN
jgi:membrane-bound lytic murein transglycosylase F